MNEEVVFMSENKKDKRRSTFQIVKRRILQDKATVIGLSIISLAIIMAIFAPFISPYDPIKPNYSETLQPPSRGHLFGTDEFGRDVFSRVIYGTRYALLIGLGVVMIEAIIGITAGTIAGYFGGKIDDVIMRIVDVFLSIPTIVLAIALAAALGGGLKNVIIATGLIIWVGFARLVRGEVLKIKQEPYIEAAKAMGINDLKIIFRHVLPNALSPIIVYTTLSMPSAILISAALSFLGLGVQPPTPEWGAMVSEGKALLGTAWWISAFPGLAILMLSLAFNMVGDGLRDALDPKLGRRR